MPVVNFDLFDKKSKIKFDHAIDLRTAPLTWVRDIPPTDQGALTFEIVSAKETFLLKAVSEEAKLQWIQKLNSVIEGVIEHSPELQKAEKAHINLAPAPSKGILRLFTIDRTAYDPTICPKLPPRKGHPTAPQVIAATLEQWGKEWAVAPRDTCASICHCLYSYEPGTAALDLPFQRGDLLLCWQQSAFGSDKWKVVRHLGYSVDQEGAPPAPSLSSSPATSSSPDFSRSRRSTVIGSTRMSPVVTNARNSGNSECSSSTDAGDDDNNNTMRLRENKQDKSRVGIIPACFVEEISSPEQRQQILTQINGMETSTRMRSRHTFIVSRNKDQPNSLQQHQAKQENQQNGGFMEEFKLKKEERLRKQEEEEERQVAEEQSRQQSRLGTSSFFAKIFPLKKPAK